MGITSSENHVHHCPPRRRGYRFSRADLTPDQEAAYRAGIDEALAAEYAVVAAVERREDNPRVNAGRGAVFTAEGTPKLDAAVMNGTPGTPRRMS